MALQVVADDGDGVSVVAAADMEGVAAEAADDVDGDVFPGAQDEEGVVALEGVDHHALDPVVLNVQTGAVDAVPGDHEVVAELGADHGDGVEAVAALDAHRRVDRVGNEVRTLAAVDVGEGGLGIVRVDLDEGAHDEVVVILLTVEPEIGRVTIDGEVVVADAAVQGGGGADAIAEVAAGREGGREVILGHQTGVEGVNGVTGGQVGRVARRGEDLADLEGVVARVTEHGNRGGGVVHHEGVVAIATVDAEVAVDVAVIVDAFDAAAGHGIPAGVDLDRGDHGGAEQEEVGRVGAVNAHTIHTGVAERRLIEQVDDRGARAGQSDFVEVASGLAGDGQAGVNAVLEGLGAELGVVDPDDVVAGRAADRGATVDLGDGEDVVSGSEVDDVGAGVGAEHRQVVVAAAQFQGQGFEGAEIDAARGVHIGAVVADVAHIEAGDARGGGADVVEEALVVGGVGVVTNIQFIHTRTAVQGQLAVDAVEEAVLGGIEGADQEDVVAVVAEDQRRAGVGRSDVEVVVGRTKADVERFQAGVEDPAPRVVAVHAETGELVAGEVTRVGGRVTGVIHIHRVGIGPAVDRERGGDQIHRAQLVGQSGLRADTDHVVAGARIDSGRAGDAADVDVVVAGARFQQRGAGVGFHNGEGVVTTAKEYFDRAQVHKVDLAALAQSGAGHALVFLEREHRIGGQPVGGFTPGVDAALVAQAELLHGVGGAGEGGQGPDVAVEEVDGLTAAVRLDLALGVAARFIGVEDVVAFEVARDPAGGIEHGLADLDQFVAEVPELLARLEVNRGHAVGHEQQLAAVEDLVGAGGVQEGGAVAVEDLDAGREQIAEVVPQGFGEDRLAAQPEAVVAATVHDGVAEQVALGVADVVQVRRAVRVVEHRTGDEVANAQVVARRVHLHRAGDGIGDGFASVVMAGDRGEVIIVRVRAAMEDGAAGSIEGRDRHLIGVEDAAGA